MKRFYDINNNGSDYDAVSRRKGQDLFYILGGDKVGGQPGTGAKPKPSGLANKGPGLSSGAKSSVGTSKPAVVGKTSAAKGSSGGSNDEEIKQLQSEMQEMRVNMDTLEKERDFYFGKLRDIEMLLQGNPALQNQLTENILKILYASEEEKVTIEEDGSLAISPAGG